MRKRKEALGAEIESATCQRGDCKVSKVSKAGSHGACKVQKTPNDFTVWLSWYSEGCLCLLRSQPLFFLLFQPLCLLSHQFIAQTNTTMSKPGKWTVLVKLEAHVPEYLEQHWWGHLSSTPEASKELSACFFPIRLHL